MTNHVLITGKDGFIGQRIRGGRKFVGDVTDLHAVKEQLMGCDGVVHLAAVSDHRSADDDPTECLFTNLIGLHNVLVAAYLSCRWVIFASTFQVRDRTIYGLSKLMGEELCLLHKKRGLCVKILRLPVVYGPGDRQAKLVTRMITMVRRGIEPKIDTKDKFYFAYVDDVARMIEREADVLEFRPGKKIKLTDLSEGIKKCLTTR